MAQSTDNWQPVLNGRWVTKKSKTKGKGQHVYLEEDGSISYSGPNKRASKSEDKPAESENTDAEKKGEGEEEIDTKEAARAAKDKAKANKDKEKAKAKAEKDAQRKENEAYKKAWKDWYRVNPKGWSHLSSKVKAKHGMDKGKEGDVGESGGEGPSREFNPDSGKSIEDSIGIQSAEKFMESVTEAGPDEEIKTNAYNPSQKRANDGKWTSGGGGGSGSKPSDSNSPSSSLAEQSETPSSDSSQEEGEKGTLAKFSGWMKKKAAAVGSKVLDAAKSMVAKAPAMAAGMVKKSAQIVGKGIATAADRYGDFGSLCVGSIGFLAINAVTVGGAGIVGGALFGAGLIETRKVVGGIAALATGDKIDREEAGKRIAGKRDSFKSRFTTDNAETPVPPTGQPTEQPVDGEQPEGVPEGLAEYICEFIADFYQQMELGAPPDVTPEQVQPMLETMLQYVTTQDQEPAESDEPTDPNGGGDEEKLATDQHETVPVKNHWKPV